MKASLQGCSAPAKGWGAARPGPAAEAGPCQLPVPWAGPPSLAQTSRAGEWEGNQSPARRARRESPSRQTKGIGQGGALVCLERRCREAPYCGDNVVIPASSSKEARAPWPEPPAGQPACLHPVLRRAGRALLPLRGGSVALFACS